MITITWSFTRDVTNGYCIYLSEFYFYILKAEEKAIVFSKTESLKCIHTKPYTYNIFY